MTFAGLTEEQFNMLLCCTHYLTRRHLADSVVPGDYPAAVPHWALRRHFHPNQVSQVLAQLEELGLVQPHPTVSEAHFFTRRAVGVLIGADIIPSEFAHNFGDYPTPDVGNDDLEQLPDEDDDDFEERCSNANMDALEEIDYEMDRWAEEVWETPSFMLPARLYLEKLAASNRTMNLYYIRADDDCGENLDFFVSAPCEQVARKLYYDRLTDDLEREDPHEVSVRLYHIRWPNVAKVLSWGDEVMEIPDRKAHR